MRVEVYVNTRKNCLSIRALEGEYKGYVISHKTSVDLVNVKMVVQPAGLARVLRENRKNVHAFARGDLYPEKGWVIQHPSAKGGLMWYDPYKHDSFVDRVTGNPVLKADWVGLTKTKYTSLCAYLNVPETKERKM